jgi:hypothetical protein
VLFTLARALNVTTLGCTFAAFISSNTALARSHCLLRVPSQPLPLELTLPKPTRRVSQRKINSATLDGKVLRRV